MQCKHWLTRLLILVTRWQKILMGIRKDKKLFKRSGWNKLSEKSIKLNVLIFGIDSLSRMMWMRKLPKTYEYVTNKLKGVVFKGYNIVGDGTVAALTAVLTGKTTLELPDTQKSSKSRASFVDVYPFIWKDFEKNGYVTAWSEDSINVGTYTLRLKGFQKQPVDHYSRTFYSATFSETSRHYKFCYGEKSYIQIKFDFIENMYKVYNDKPKFIFTFSVPYTHDDVNGAGAIDDDIYEWLCEFNEKNYLNNTLLILMSDHGARYKVFRQTHQGLLEERLPGLMFIFPPWFSEKYPEAYKNFRSNFNKLTTPFDVYETLKNIIYFRGGQKGNLKHRGISLFQEIPPTRTCFHADIESHWCTCLDRKNISVNNSNVKNASLYFVDALNRYTSEHRDLCAKLELEKIISSSELTTKNAVLKHQNALDSEGFPAGPWQNTSVSLIVYLIKVVITPGEMMFEASVNYHQKTKKFMVSETEISRLDEYKNMTHCLQDYDKLHNLFKYCYCI